MKLLDVAAMRELAEELYVVRIARVYGDKGADALRAVLDAVNTAYRRVAYEMLTDGLLVFQPLDPDARPLGEEPALVIADEQDITQGLRAPATVQVLADGRLLVWDGLADRDMLADAGVVYGFDGSDYFWLQGVQRVDVKAGSPFPSIFGLPTFTDLLDALHHYKRAEARYSSSDDLGALWREPNRLVFVNSPEERMRRALEKYLRHTLRGHELIEVRPEQVVDETHPVDIKVTFAFSTSLALIEIKWLGHSISADGTHFSQSFSAQRARDGARQLAEYLDENRPRAPENVTMGYLVLYDGRRRAVRPDSAEVSAENGMAYANAEIEWHPAYHEQRLDCAEPVRMFMEPVCT